MYVSTKGRYALRLLTDMAEQEETGYLPLKEIAQRQGISEKYLESIAKVLVSGGFLVGVRGKGGGYRLSCPPEQICVADVLEQTEGTLAPVACLSAAENQCERREECRTLSLWEGLEQAVADYLRGWSVRDLMRQA